MSQDSSIARHQNYNNRFRTSSTGVHDINTVVPTSLSSGAAQGLDLFGHSVHFGQPTSAEDVGHGDIRATAGQRIITGQEQPSSCSQVSLAMGPPGSPTAGVLTGEQPNTHRAICPTPSQTSSQAPTAPGQPRRVSRQLSTGARRQNFAAGRSVSGGNSTSQDSTRDDVFMELNAEAVSCSQLHKQRTSFDSSMFPGKRGQILSTSSSVSAMPNPYNRLNHRLHSAVWFCNCLTFVFFCCLPAIHFMEQSDVRFRMDDLKAASRLAKVSTALFVLGTMLTLLFFGMIFFLVIFFTTR